MQKNHQNNSSSSFLKTDAAKTKSNAIEVPSIDLPKSGAIKGIDEKFSVNAVNVSALYKYKKPNPIDVQVGGIVIHVGF